MKNPDFAGIDVSAKELVVAIKRGQRAPRLLTFDNNPAGHRKLVRFLTKGGRSARVCLESTGVYVRPLEDESLIYSPGCARKSPTIPA